MSALSPTKVRRICIDDLDSNLPRRIPWEWQSGCSFAEGIVAMTPPVRVYQLKSGDMERMRAMLAMFGEAFNEIDTYTARQPNDAYLENLLANNNFIALAAVRDNVVAGGLAAYELPKFEQERSEIYIYDLAVAEDWRRQGIATTLIRQLQDIAAARAAHVVFVQADYGDDPAISLYSRLGHREDVLHFDIAVPGKPGRE
jgi:aminoglycoside 3-N-acetyltransferase I